MDDSLLTVTGNIPVGRGMVKTSLLVNSFCTIKFPENDVPSLPMVKRCLNCFPHVDDGKFKATPLTAWFETNVVPPITTSFVIAFTIEYWYAHPLFWDTRCCSNAAGIVNVHVTGFVVVLMLEMPNTYGPPVNGFGMKVVAMFFDTPDTE
jgi:hypothetical protein